MELIDRARRIEAQLNDGRGVSCARDALSFLAMGHESEASRIIEWDHDKLRNYPGLQLVFAQMFPDYLKWLSRPGELVHDLNLHIGESYLMSLTAVQMASKDIQHGKVNSAMYHLRVDADKIRVKDAWLYQVIQAYFV
jgi:hypothetical protein